jgi:hypothetical protein
MRCDSSNGDDDDDSMRPRGIDSLGGKKAVNAAR